MKQSVLILWLAFLFALSTGTGLAQRTNTNPRHLESVGVNEKLGETIPIGITFTNADGEEVSLQSYFDGTTPVLLNFGYYNCPMLCDRVWDGMTTSLQELDWTAGQKFKVVTIGIAPEETSDDSRRKRANLLRRLDGVAANSGWYFHTGTPANVDSLAKAVGFQYRAMEQSQQMDESFQQYAHPAVLITLSGDGKITRYLYGIQYESRSMKNALMEASDGQVGNVVDRVMLYCSQFDPNANEYVADAWAIMRLGGVLTVILLSGALFFLWRHERQKREEIRTRSTAS
jgi:protein SCO1/2